MDLLVVLLRLFLRIKIINVRLPLQLILKLTQLVKFVEPMLLQPLQQYLVAAVFLKHQVVQITEKL